MAYEDLRDVVLVGHSYAACPVTVVADQAGDRLSHVVYVDSAPLPSGQGMLDFYGPEEAAQLRRKVAEQGDGWKLPYPGFENLGPPPMLAGLGPAERALLEGKSTHASVRQLRTAPAPGPEPGQPPTRAGRLQRLPHAGAGRPRPGRLPHPRLAAVRSRDQPLADVERPGCAGRLPAEAAPVTPVSPRVKALREGEVVPVDVGDGEVTGTVAGILDGPDDGRRRLRGTRCTARPPHRR